jgi:phosphatidylinositol alpha-1,6-mannosyltransferase
VRAPLAFSQWGIRSLTGLRHYWRTFRVVSRVARRERADAIHCGRCLPEGWIGWLLKQRYGLRYICYIYGEELNYASASRELAWLMRRVLNGADFLIAISKNTERILRQDWAMPPHRIRLLYPGVDTQRFLPAARDPALRLRLGWGNRPVLLTVGRLQKRKGHDQMILALHSVRKAAPDILYAIVGDGEELDSLTELVAQERLQPHVQFLGELNEQELIHSYQQCDLFTLPNRQVGQDIEGFGMVLLEAQACGKPVVAGASGGTAETMRVPDTGRIVPCEVPDELARTVIDLLSDPARLDRMGRAARRWVVAQFDWQPLSQRAAEILGVTVPNPARRPSEPLPKLQTATLSLLPSGDHTGNSLWPGSKRS